jgi:hypothetical protein
MKNTLNKFRILFILLSIFTTGTVYAYDIEGTVSTEFESFDYVFPSESFVNINGLLKSTKIEPGGYFVFHNVPAGEYTITVIVPGFEHREMNVKVPMEEELIITIELPVDVLEPITVTGKKEEWEKTLENLLSHNPDSENSEPDNNIYSPPESDNVGGGGIPFLTPIIMLVRWLKNNF